MISFCYSLFSFKKITANLCKFSREISLILSFDYGIMNAYLNEF